MPAYETSPKDLIRLFVVLLSYTYKIKLKEGRGRLFCSQTIGQYFKILEQSEDSINI